MAYAEGAVLLVDDDDNCLQIVRHLLLNAGIEPVHTINDSRQVLPYMVQHKVSLIVLDLVMPFVSGLDLLPQLRFKFPEIPVIIGSASNETASAVECMRHGVLDFHVKPLDAAKLIGSVKKALRMKDGYVDLFGLDLTDDFD